MMMPGKYEYVLDISMNYSLCTTGLLLSER